MIVYITQNYWVSGLCFSSRIVNIRNHSISEPGSASILRLGNGDTCSVGSLEKLRLGLSKVPNGVGVSFHSPEDGKIASL
jgi:hypothetical protein